MYILCYFQLCKQQLPGISSEYDRLQRELNKRESSIMGEYSPKSVWNQSVLIKKLNTEFYSVKMSLVSPYMFKDMWCWGSGMKRLEC